MTSGIYGLCCKATGKWYVGASTQIEKRLKEHRKQLREAIKCKLPIQQVNCHRMGLDAAIYGLQTIQAVILEQVDDPALLNEREIYWAEQLDAVEGGYNQHVPFPDRRW